MRYYFTFLIINISFIFNVYALCEILISGYGAFYDNDFKCEFPIIYENCEKSMDVIINTVYNKPDGQWTRIEYCGKKDKFGKTFDTYSACWRSDDSNCLWAEFCQYQKDIKEVITEKGGSCINISVPHIGCIPNPSCRTIVNFNKQLINN